MNWKIAGVSAVFGVAISYFTWSYFSLGTLVLPFLVVLFFFAALSIITLVSSVVGTIRILNQEPPLKEKIAERRAEMMKGRSEVQKEHTKEVKGRLEQLIAQGKDPFETGISDLDKITKAPETKKKGAKTQKKGATGEKETKTGK